MSKDRDEWPSFTEELDRKSLEQVEKWSKAYDAEKISTREFFIAISAIYDTSSGLASKGVSDLIANVHEEIRRNGKKQ